MSNSSLDELRQAYPKADISLFADADADGTKWECQAMLDSTSAQFDGGGQKESGSVQIRVNAVASNPTEAIDGARYALDEAKKGELI